MTKNSKKFEYAPINIVYRTFIIGTNDNCDLCLTKYDKKCEFASAKHACIYYDKFSNHYELLNYSENGTVVDNILFSNDISIKRNDEVMMEVTNDENSDSNCSSCSNEDSLNSRPKMSSKPNRNYWSCQCQSSLTDVFNGKCWEGSAILNHGSHLKFGCLEFVFCIVDRQYL